MREESEFLLGEAGRRLSVSVETGFEMHSQPTELSVDSTTFAQGAGDVASDEDTEPVKRRLGGIGANVQLVAPSLSTLFVFLRTSIRRGINTPLACHQRENAEGGVRGGRHLGVGQFFRERFRHLLRGIWNLRNAPEVRAIV